MHLGLQPSAAKSVVVLTSYAVKTFAMISRPY